MRLSNTKAFVVFLFVLSGMCGLIYEVAWSKYLSLFIGSTAYSHMIVLATFMGGLALGAFYWGRFADKFANQLRLYGMIEIAIGIYCIAYPFLIGLCEKLFVKIAMPMDLVSNQTLLLILKFFLSFITLILPTFFMGGTLPILTKFLTKNIDDAGKDVATLYYINSLGAVLGSVLAGFFLIRIYSLDGAVWIAAVLNLVIGLTAVYLSRGIKTESLQKETVSEPTKGIYHKFSVRTIRLAIITAALSGFIAMIYELTWIRLLSNILGSSTYSFSLMLIAFISGITLGSWIVSIFIKKIKNLISFLYICQLGTAVSMIFTLPLYDRLPYYLLKISSLMSNKPENFPLFLFSEFLFCFLIMIIPTTLSGMSLPIASRIASNDIKFLGKSIGGIFSINTIGTVLGAITTGLILIPQLGIKQSLEFGVLLNGLLGVVIIFYDKNISLRWKIGTTALLISIGVGYRIQFPSWDERVAIFGVFRNLFERDYRAFEEFRDKMMPNSKILWYKEGINANVAICETPKRDTLQRSLIINGKPDASTIGDLTTQILLAQTPLMLLPDTGDALVVGLGSGITCGSALRHPIRTLDCVEISSEVVEANSFFSNENYNFLHDPRVKLYIDDAITYLKITQKKYNYIISEPSNPWIAGIGNLFSIEFFGLCKNHLQQGGVLAQWFHTYEMDDQNFRLIMRTVTQVFPYISIWKTSDPDILILASEVPIEPNFFIMEKKFTIPSIADDLARIKVYDVPTLLSTQITSQINPSAIFSSGPVNSEKKPLLEFTAPISLFTGASINLVDSIDERFSPHQKNLMFGEYVAKRTLFFENYLNIVRFRGSEDVGDYRFVYSTLKKCLQINPDNVEVIGDMVKTTKVLGFNEERLSSLRKLSEIYHDDVEVISTYVGELLSLLEHSSSITNPLDMNEPIQLLRRCIELTNGKEVKYTLLLALTLTDAGHFRESAELYKNVLELLDREKIVLESIPEEQLAILAAENFLLADDLQEAEQCINLAKMKNPENEQIPILTRKILQRRKGLL